MGDFVRESFLKDKNIHVIKNGVDLNVFKPVSNTEEKEEGSFNILAVSNVWNKDKGLEDIYNLRNILPAEYKITMVGLSADQVNRLPSGIVGIQRTQNVQELVQLYSDADVLINPTYADTFPTVNLEALACGTPVITYKTGGSPEAIDENTGAVVEQGDLNALSETIKEFQVLGFKQKHSVDCRKRSEAHFDKDKCFEKYIELYNGLLK
jgi:glycosyltransferase involved in cell wall biosynthesis